MRTALVLNPFTPAPIALCLLPLLRRPTLVHLRDAGDGSPGVCEAAARLVALGARAA